MIHILRLILTQMVLSLRSRAELQVENLALRHQIEILKRTAPKRARLTKTDRLIFTWLLRLWPKSAQLVRIVHPKTLVRWHREGFRVYWRWKSRRRGGRPKAPNEVRVCHCSPAPSRLRQCDPASGGRACAQRVGTPAGPGGLCDICPVVWEGRRREAPPYPDR